MSIPLLTDSAAEPTSQNGQTTTHVKMIGTLTNRVKRLFRTHGRGAHGTRTRDAKPVGRSRRDRRRDERPPVSRHPPTPKVEPVASLSRGRGRPRPQSCVSFSLETRDRGLPLRRSRRDRPTGCKTRSVERPKQKGRMRDLKPETRNQKPEDSTASETGMRPLPVQTPCRLRPGLVTIRGRRFYEHDLSGGGAVGGVRGGSGRRAAGGGAGRAAAAG